MGWPVLAEADGVVRHDVDDACLGQRRHAHGGAHVVCEDEECRTVWDQARRVQREACNTHICQGKLRQSTAITQPVVLRPKPVQTSVYDHISFLFRNMHTITRLSPLRRKATLTLP